MSPVSSDIFTPTSTLQSRFRPNEPAQALGQSSETGCFIHEGKNDLCKNFLIRSDCCIIFVTRNGITAV